MGYIYIIKNIVNDKVYIGQTIQSIEERYRQHINTALANKINSKVYIAMREIGIDNFYIEPILECSTEDLNKYEQYYVEYYNSLNNGYNSVYPCSSNGKRPVHDYEDKVIELYNRGYSFASMAKELNISTQHANEIILKHGVHRDIQPKGKGNGAKCVIMYTKDFEPICAFKTMMEAYEWLVHNTEFHVSTFGAYAYIDVACNNGNVAYGHRWQCWDNLLCDGKVFRTKFDKEAYINGGKAYVPNGANYYIVDNALDVVKTMKKRNYCIDCGVELNSNKNKRCSECNNKAKRIHNNAEDIALEFICKQCNRKVSHLNAHGLCVSCSNVVAKGKSPKPSKEELQSLLNKGLQKKQIAEIYGRTDSTVHYWIQSYGLK